MTTKSPTPHFGDRSSPSSETGRASSRLAPAATATAEAIPVAIDTSDSTRESEASEAELIQRTKTQIRSLVKEIADLSTSGCTVDEFFQGFLTRTVSALASVGGAVWLKPSPASPLELNYQINLKQAGLTEDERALARHGLLLNQMAAAGEPAIAGPMSGNPEAGAAGNPTECLLVFGVLDVDQTTIGLIEIFQRPGAGPTTQRGYLRFVTQMSEIASEFLRNQELRKFRDQQKVWQDLEQFIRQIHCGLDRDQTVFKIANEGRQILGCDRVSVALQPTNGRATIRAVSGLDSIERRADQVKALGSLASRVIRSGEPLWYCGEDDDLPPQIEKRLHDYVDRSHCKLLGIIPLLEPPIGSGVESDLRSHSPKKLGALIIEQLGDSVLTESFQDHVGVVA